MAIEDTTMTEGNNSNKAHSRYAARRPAGTEHPVTLSKNGVRHVQRLADGSTREIISCGLACSECFSGPTLYKILKPGFDFERRVMEDLSMGRPAAPLSIHTSSGVPEALEGFLQALERHLPWKNEDDWCVSLQMEGASAVWAAIDMVLQVSLLENANAKNRTKVAVGATSYHGPPSTSFGAKSPLWSKKHHQLIYPVPTAFGTYDEELLLQKYATFLEEHAHEIGVLLIEPQWGSSQAALPWPRHLLERYIQMARQHGIKIVCDEIMCANGRHGKGTLFISRAWNLNPDAITFGKAIATGVFPLSGAILKTGRTLLQRNKCSVMQSHTYAGSSTRALMAATEVLRELDAWLPAVAHLGDELAHIMAYLQKISQGLLTCQGQGLMWGGIVTHQGKCRDQEYRAKVVQAFKEQCDGVAVVPYHVPVGGFMISPVIDIDVGTIYEIGQRLEQAILRTLEQVEWEPIDTTTINSNYGMVKNDSRVFRAPLIASATTLDLVELAELEGASETARSFSPQVSMDQDLGNDKCVPYLHQTKCCTSCNSFVCKDVRTRFLGTIG